MVYPCIQVTDTELQAMSKQGHVIIPPDIQSETVVESSQSEESVEEGDGLIGQPMAGHKEDVVNVPVTGLDKYKLEQQVQLSSLVLIEEATV